MKNIFLASFLIVAFFLSSCTSTQTDETLVNLSAQSVALEFEEQTLLSVSPSGFETILQVTWQIEQGNGELSADSGMSVVFTAATVNEDVEITATVVASDQIASDTIVLTVTEPDTTAPSKPAGVEAVPGDDIVTIQWTANTESDLTGYYIYYSDTSGIYPSVDDNRIDVSSATSYTFTNLTNNIPYYFMVTALDSNGNESLPSTEITATAVDMGPPDTPAIFQATNGSGKSINLTWINPINSDFTGVKVLRSETSAPTTHEESDGNTLVYEGSDEAYTDDDEELVYGKLYYYSIFAYDDILNYSESNETYLLLQY